MKTLKSAGIILLVLVAIFLLVAALIPGDVSYEKAISINAPVEVVWENVNSLQAMDKWTPWNEYDPNMEKEFSGADGKVGSKMSWKSDNENVGTGSQIIAKSDPPIRIDTDLKFYDPYESEAKVYINLEKEADGTKVTWGFQSKIPYPFTIMKLFVNMEEMMDEDWNKGLSNLKNLSES